MKKIFIFSFVMSMLFVACIQLSEAGEEKIAAKEKGDKEESDLERSVDELVALICEHKKKTYECDECRYEVGFVRAPSELHEGGLITLTKGEYKQVAAPITLTGEVRFDERRTIQVSPQAEGVIRQVHVALGEDVKKGQPLVEIDSIAVGDNQAANAEAQAQLALARRNFERLSELRKENIASEKAFLQARQELDAAKARAVATYGKLNRLGSNGSAVGRLVLEAPIDGMIQSIRAVSGEVAKAGETLVTVGDNSTVWVWADVYEKDIAAVKKGQSVQNLAASISVKAYPGEEFSGIVDLISPSMDEASRTLKLRIRVNNGDGRLLAGMFANVKLFLPGDEGVLAVPRHAVLDDEGRSFVFVHYRGEYYLRRPVTAGRVWGDWIEVSQGLDDSQIVVAEGAFLMKSDVLRSKMGAGCAD